MVHAVRHDRVRVRQGNHFFRLPGFRPKAIILVSDLPETRGMKIMRPVVRAIYVGAPPEDLSSPVNPEALEELRIAVGK